MAVILSATRKETVPLPCIRRGVGRVEVLDRGPAGRLQQEKGGQGGRRGLGTGTECQEGIGL